jgi:hypothetical protein
MENHTSLENLRKSLIERFDDGESWAAMARGYEVNPAVLWRIVKESYNPKKKELRSKLGLPELITMEVQHGEDGYKMSQTT